MNHSADTERDHRILNCTNQSTMTTMLSTTISIIMVALIAVATAVAALDLFLPVESFGMKATTTTTRLSKRVEKTDGVLRSIPTRCCGAVTKFHSECSRNDHDMTSLHGDDAYMNEERIISANRPSYQESRRSVMKMGVQIALGLQQLSTVCSANAASYDTVNINVNPIAHTFAVSGPSSKPKPIRENDATRILTNARVVILFVTANGDSGKTDSLVNDVVELTIKRKEECGPGVTPGSVIRMTATTKSNLVDPIVKSSSSSETGDVLVFGPIPSQGITNDGKLKDDVASKLGTFVGSSKSGGIVSVLLDGPTQNVVVSDDGYTISDLLWYSLPIS